MKNPVHVATTGAVNMANVFATSSFTPSITIPFPPLHDHKYASYVPKRRQHLRLHGTKNGAKRSIYCEDWESGLPRGGIVYEFEDGEWKNIVEWWPDATCFHCNKIISSHKYRDNSDEYGSYLGYNVPIRERKFVHRKCKRELMGV